MRHISRTHRVALDLLFDRINLDPKIQIKYVDTKKQLIIFSLCSISAFSSLPAAPKRCRKRMQQVTGEERIVAKLKPTLAASSSTAPSSSAFHRPGMLRAPRQSLSLTASAGRLAAEDSNYDDAVSSSQVWQSDAKTNDSARRLAAAGTQQNLDFQDSARRFAAENSDIIDDDAEWPSDYRISRAYVSHFEKVYATLRQKTWSQAWRQNGRPRCEVFDVRNVYVCQPECRSSSWNGLLGEFAFYQQSATTNIKTIVRCD